MKTIKSLVAYLYKGLLLTTVSMVFANSGIAIADEDVIRLNFGVYSSNKPTAMVREFKPTLKALETSMSNRLNRPVDIRMQIAKDYDQGVSDLINGKVDFSRFGPASYIQAKSENSGLELLAIESNSGEKVFYGIIAVHKDSGINEIGDLRNRSFAFGDESSTIGRFLSQHYLMSNGIRSADLSGFKYLGRHDIVGTAVGAGDYDAGALNESTFKKLVAAGEPIRELARFPNVTKPWIARNGLAPELLQALQESLYELKDPAALKTLKADGFLPGTDTDYETIRLSMQDNDLFFKEASESNRSGSKFKEEVKTSGIDAKAKASNIQINITFEDAIDAENTVQSIKQPLIVNLTIPGNASKNKDVIVTTTTSGDTSQN